VRKPLIKNNLLIKTTFKINYMAMSKKTRALAAAKLRKKESKGKEDKKKDDEDEEKFVPSWVKK
jgi:hypothetical protein